MSVPGQSRASHGSSSYRRSSPRRSRTSSSTRLGSRSPLQLEDVVWDYQPLSRRQPGRGLRAGNRDRPVRDEARPGRSRAGAAERAGIESTTSSSRHWPSTTTRASTGCGDLDQSRLTTRRTRRRRPSSLSLGVDTTDLVITNGYRVWQRSIQIGGSHFTKALTKELKLTFAKAEHLKKNAAKAEDPKAVFQAMRPVFSDLVAEVQRSIGFFSKQQPRRRIERGRRGRQRDEAPRPATLPDSEPGQSPSSWSDEFDNARQAGA